MGNLEGKLFLPLMFLKQYIEGFYSTLRKQEGGSPFHDKQKLWERLIKNYKTELENKTRKEKSEIPEIKNLQAK